MSPRGHEDWGVSSAAVQAAPDLPGAEIAARLGALSTFDQTGQLLFADGFEWGFTPWVSQTAGAGATLTLDGALSYLGGYSAKCTGGSDGNRYAGVTKDLPRPFLSRWGLETRAVLASAGGQLMVRARHATGSLVHTYEVRVDMASGDLTLLQSDGTYVTVRAGALGGQGSAIFHPIKLVIDLVATKYVRVTLDDVALDLSAYAARDTVDASKPFVGVDVFCLSRAGANDVLNLDSVIVTQNEP